MTRKLTIIAIAAATALAGCNNEDHNIVAGEVPDPMADEPANAAPVVLPPSIQASKVYRCKDNSVLYVDWLSDGKARVKTKPNAIATTAEEGAVTGDATTPTITYNGQSCKA
ncbi:MAG: hypothetical protein M3Q52_06785 [Pseudomonadota bacterium]|nr:hypothetical protein [Pseudomonadota bacterium]